MLNGRRRPTTVGSREQGAVFLGTGRWRERRQRIEARGVARESQLAMHKGYRATTYLSGDDMVVAMGWKWIWRPIDEQSESSGYC